MGRLNIGEVEEARAEGGLRSHDDDSLAVFMNVVEAEDGEGKLPERATGDIFEPRARRSEQPRPAVTHCLVGQSAAAEVDLCRG